MRRGEIWWANLDPTVGGEISKRRPVLILSRDGLARRRRTLVVVPLSTGPTPDPPLVVGVPSAGTGSVAVCDQIRALDRSRLDRRLGQISDADLRVLEAELREALGL